MLPSVPRSCSTACVSLILTLLAIAHLANAEPKTLQDFEAEPPTIKTLDARAEIVEVDGNHALQITFGTESPYPNARVLAGPEPWDLSPYTTVLLDVTNTGEASVALGMRVDNQGATGRKNQNTGGTTLAPGESGTVRVDIDRYYHTQLRESLAGMKATPWGKRGENVARLDPSSVVQINLFVSHPHETYSVRVDDLRVEGSFDPATMNVPEPFFPFVDTYGQYLHGDWPGKIRDDDDLREQARQEAQDVEDTPRPGSWDRYGGWADGPQLEATGHFRTAKHEGRWHLVDPDGRLFFSLGVTGVRVGGATVIDQGRDDWFANPPWKSDDPAMQAFLGSQQVRRGEYAKQNAQTFEFMSANLLRKYGPDWRQQWLQRTPRRLMNWGLNTIANWSDTDLFENTSIPYTHWVYINLAKLPWQQGDRNRISDPFHPDFADNLRRRVSAMTRGSTEDPWCIGYFLDNELTWGHESHLARGLLAGKPAVHAKQKLFSDLEAQYGDIAALNTAWDVDYDSWAAALQNESAVDPQTPQAKADLRAFNRQIAEAYFSNVKQAFRAVAPHKLYLGPRFAEYNPQVVEVAAKYCDVVTFNLYRDSVAGWRPMKEFDAPVIVGEFHFGAADRGVFSRGLRPAESTQDKARRFHDYVVSAVGNPLIVGTHWFQFNDQPTTGRPMDTENHGIGFVSIADVPHDAMIRASRAVAEEIYGPAATSAAAPLP